MVTIPVLPTPEISESLFCDSPAFSRVSLKTEARTRGIVQEAGLPPDTLSLAKYCNMSALGHIWITPHYISWQQTNHSFFHHD